MLSEDDLNLKQLNKSRDSSGQLSDQVFGSLWLSLLFISDLVLAPQLLIALHRELQETILLQIPVDKPLPRSDIRLSYP